MAIDWLQTVKDRESELRGLYKRMDDDEKLKLQDDYKLKDTSGNDMKKVVNMTANDPATFDDKIVSAINKASRFTVVESASSDGKKMDDKKTTKIENGIDDMLDAGDKRLQRRGLPGICPVVNEQACERGRIGGRWLVRRDKEGKLYIDILPMDTRYMAYEFGEDGMKWGSFFIKKSKTQLKSNYNIDYRGSSGELREIWTTEESIYYLDDMPLTKTGDGKPIGGPHKIGRVPLVYTIVPVGSFLQGKDSEKHSGESIFWLDRKLYAEKSRCLSIFQTQNMMSIRPPTQYESDLGEFGILPDESPYEIDSIIAVQQGAGYKPMPRSDMWQASRFAYSLIEQMIQRGSLSSLDYGNLTFPLSAVAIGKVTDEKDTIFFPRLDTIAIFYQLGLELLFLQHKQMGGTLELGRSATKTSYSVSDFDGDYNIKFTWKTLDPVQNVANISLANAAKGIYPEEMILRDIAQVDNPQEVMNMRKADDAYRESPILRKVQQVQALIAIGKNDDAELMAMTELGMSIDEVMSGAVAKPKEVTEPTGEPLIPLLGEGSRGLGPRQAEKTSARESAEMKSAQAVEE